MGLLINGTWHYADDKDQIDKGECESKVQIKLLKEIENNGR
jgi:hypothetical protein